MLLKNGARVRLSQTGRVAWYMNPQGAVGTITKVCQGPHEGRGFTYIVLWDGFETHGGYLYHRDDIEKDSL